LPQVVQRIRQELTGSQIKSKVPFGGPELYFGDSI